MVKYFTEKREGSRRGARLLPDDETDSVLDRDLQLRRRVNFSHAPSKPNCLLFSDRSSLYIHPTPKKKTKRGKETSRKQNEKNFLFGFNKLSNLFEENLHKNKLYFFKTVIKNERLLLDQLRIYKNQNKQLQSMVQRLKLNDAVRRNSFKKKFLELKPAKIVKQEHGVSSTKSTKKIEKSRSDFIEQKDSYVISQDSRMEYSRSSRVSNHGTQNAIRSFRQLTEYIKSTIEKDSDDVSNLKSFLQRTKERTIHGQRGDIPCSVYNSKALMGVKKGHRRSGFTSRGREQGEIFGKKSLIFGKESPLSLRLTKESTLSLMKRPRDVFRKAKLDRLKMKDGSSKKRKKKSLNSLGKRRSCQGRI